MGSDTDVGMVALGGAVAFVVVWLIQWLLPGAPVSPELSIAFGTIFTTVFTYLLPALAHQRRSRRAGPEVHRQ